jgi:hypothetical protein
MPVNRSYADIFAEWAALGASREEPEADPVAELPRQRELAVVHARAIALQAEKFQLEAARQKKARELREVVDYGLDLARDLRAELRGHLGSRSEDLVRYDIKPLRVEGRRRRRKKGEAEEPEVTEAK